MKVVSIEHTFLRKHALIFATGSPKNRTPCSSECYRTTEDIALDAFPACTTMLVYYRQGKYQVRTGLVLCTLSCSLPLDSVTFCKCTHVYNTHSSQLIYAEMDVPNRTMRLR